MIDVYVSPTSSLLPSCEILEPGPVTPSLLLPSNMKTVCGLCMAVLMLHEDLMVRAVEGHQILNR